MNRKIKSLFPAFCIITISIFLASLGFWQLARLDEKNYFISKIADNIISQGLPFEQINQKDIFYSKIKLNGQFLDGHDIYLYGRFAADRKSGYYLITPFLTVNNKIILVARGWFSSENKNNIKNIKPEPYQEIVGIALKGENARIFVPTNDLKNNIWFTLDLEEAAILLNRRVEKFYLIQIDGQMIDHIKPININNLLKIKNDHLEYAITWFCLSAALIIIFIIYQKPKFYLKKQ